MKPSAVFRKTKVNGTNRDWPEAQYTLEHTIYLRLPQALEESGQSYTLTIAPAINSDVSRGSSRLISSGANPKPCTSTSSGIIRTD